MDMAVSRKPSISIVIPVLNEEKRLVACLDSIGYQTELPDEVLVVDNGSTDRSVSVAKSFGFVTVLNEPRSGVVYARNRGFDAAKSNIIARIDADTHLPVNWVEYVKNFYADDKNHNHGLTGGGYFYNVRLPHLGGWLQSQMAYRLNRAILGHYIFWGSNMALPSTVWSQMRDKVCKRTDIHEDVDLAIHAHEAHIPITYHAGLQVGVEAKRLLSQHNELLTNLLLWPRTLRLHGKRGWIFGWLGAVLLYIASPAAKIAEIIARSVGRPPLED